MITIAAALRTIRRALNRLRGVPLVLACLAPAACCADHEPPAQPEPLDCKVVDLAGYCANTRCVSVLKCNRAPTADDYPDAVCDAVDEPGRWSCCFPSVHGGCDSADGANGAKL